MEIEDVKIEDAADANYVIRKFFNNQFTDMKMSMLEQLVLTVYNMGKKNGAPGGGSADPVSGGSNTDAFASTNPFFINDRAKTIEDIEIGKSGIIIKADTVGTVSSLDGDMVSFLFESDEDGEMIETGVLCSRLEKISE